MARPNLVLFMPDQLRADAVGAFGNPVVRTPNIDALAGRGSRWSDAFAQHSVCGPSRVSFFTGWYPHVAGHRTLTNPVKPWQPNLLQLERGPFPYDLKAGLQHDDPTTVGRAIAVRTRDWADVYRLYEDDELYDRRADPDELDNLAGTMPEVERRLRDQVLAWAVSTSDVIPWTPDPRF